LGVIAREISLQGCGSDPENLRSRIPPAVLKLPLTLHIVLLDTGSQKLAGMAAFILMRNMQFDLRPMPEKLGAIDTGENRHT